MSPNVVAFRKSLEVVRIIFEKFSVERRDAQLSSEWILIEKVKCTELVAISAFLFIISQQDYISFIQDSEAAAFYDVERIYGAKPSSIRKLGYVIHSFRFP